MHQVLCLSDVYTVRFVLYQMCTLEDVYPDRGVTCQMKPAVLKTFEWALDMQLTFTGSCF